MGEIKKKIWFLKNIIVNKIMRIELKSEGEGLNKI